MLLPLLTACEMKKDLFGGGVKEEAPSYDNLGLLDIEIQAEREAELRADGSVSVEESNTLKPDEFAIEIADSTGQVVKSFPSLAAMKEAGELLLPVGTYSVHAAYGSDVNAGFNSPYYAGDTELTITKDVTSNASVKCTMKNSRIQLQYSDDFKSTFQQWKVTLDDGSDTALYFTDQDSDEDIYWAFDEGVSQVRVNIQATTNDGNVVRDSRTFTKSMVTEGYGDVNSEDFTGGDALVLDFKPAAPSTPTTSQVTGINVSLFITFSEYKEQIQIPVSDKEIEQPSTPPSQPEGPSTPTTPEVAAPTISLPADFTYAISGNPAKPASADAVLNTPAGLKSALVKIETNNAAFTTTLQDAAFDQAGALLTGAELIGNQAMQNLFDSIGLKEADGTPKKTPVAGVTTYTFPIAAFFTFLDLFTGTHKFHLTLTDSNNQQVTKTLTVTITE